MAFLASSSVAWVWVVTAALAAAAARLRQNLKRELKTLTSLRRELQDHLTAHPTP